MAQVQFSLDHKKYMLEFISDNQVKIIRLDDRDKCIIVQYCADTKARDFVNYIKSLDFSSCKMKGKDCRVSPAAEKKIF